MTFRISRLTAAEANAIAGANGPRLKRYLDKSADKIEAQVNEILGVQAATAAANAAAAAANTAAAAAQSTADGITDSNALANSYVTGITISAADAGSDVTITISAHTRHYPQPDGTTVDVAVSGGSLTARAYSTTYYIYYDDPSRAGGSVTYQSTTSEATAAQIGDRHTVGAIATPAAAGAATDGAYTRPPGPGSIGQLP